MPATTETWKGMKPAAQISFQVVCVPEISFQNVGLLGMCLLVTKVLLYAAWISALSPVCSKPRHFGQCLLIGDEAHGNSYPAALKLVDKPALMGPYIFTG